VRYVDNSYDVQPTYSVDPSTGKNVTAENSYHVQNKTVELAIVNQPFTRFYVDSNDTIRLFYAFQVRSSSGGFWYYENLGFYGPANPYISANGGPGEHTLLTFGLTGNNGSNGLRNLPLKSGDKADFKVQAFIGYYNKTYNSMPFGENYTYTFTGQASDWSNTQTITLSANVPLSPSPSPNTSASPTPSVPELSWLAVLPLFAVMLFIAVKLRHQKTIQ
jgi:hypothetical protein